MFFNIADPREGNIGTSARVNAVPGRRKVPRSWASTAGFENPSCWIYDATGFAGTKSSKLPVLLHQGLAACKLDQEKCSS
jgi:hypothetical protein